MPPGVKNHSQIKLPGQGEAGTRGGPPGEFHIVVSVQEHECFKRDGNDIVYELPVDFTQAALGADLKVPTIDGKAKLNVPPGTQSGAVLRITGKGIPYTDSPGRGDQVVRIRVVTPENLNAAQRRLLLDLAQSLGKSRPKKRSRKSSPAAGREAPSHDT